MSGQTIGVLHVRQSDNYGTQWPRKLKFLLEAVQNLDDIVCCLVVSLYRVHGCRHLLRLPPRHPVLPPVQQQLLRQQEHREMRGVSDGVQEPRLQHHPQHHPLFRVLLQHRGSSRLHPHLPSVANFVLFDWISHTDGQVKFFNELINVWNEPSTILMSINILFFITDCWFFFGFTELK